MPTPKRKDFEYLKNIAEYGVLTNDMLSFLMDQSLRTVQNRISTLDSMDMISQTALVGKGRKGKPKSIITLSPAGIEAVADILDDELKDIFYTNMQKEIIHKEHELLTNFYRLHLLQLERHNHNFSTEFIAPTTPFLKRRKNGLPAISDTIEINGIKRNFIPDGVCSILSKKEEKRLLFFLESDRASESMNGSTDAADIKTKFENYHHYLISGTYKRYEKKWDNLTPGFRLLILCDSDKRKRQLTQFVSHYSALDYVWITDSNSLQHSGIGERIWLRGGNSSIPPQSILGSQNTCTLPTVFPS